MRAGAVIILIMFFIRVAIAGPARAHWVSSSHILLKLPQGIHVFNGMQFVLAEKSPSSPLPNATKPSYILPLIEYHNHIASLSTADLDANLVDQLLQKPMKLFVTNKSGQVLDSTSLHFTGLLNQNYFYDQSDLGVLSTATGFSAKIWAPTAAEVTLHLYPKADSDPQHPEQMLSMKRSHGVWACKIPSQYKNYFYLYKVTVFQPVSDQIESSLVTDPYSFALAMNAEKSQIIDPEDPSTKPVAWKALKKPRMNSLKDTVLYEIHLRDFTIADESMPEVYRGTFLAFAQGQAKSMQHLADLAKSGLTHVELLPINDFGSVNEDKSRWQNFSGPRGALEEPQTIIDQIRGQDPYNWGYDPVHYFSPEGSYAVKQDGPSRLLEVRTMVDALAKMNLRVVQDVVFNHTYHKALEPHSVFDKIVPLYYYRLNDEGEAYSTSCCADTASENRMMEKLMLDAVVYWAKTFKIDGFRFDLMSFHSHDTMIRIREALRRLTVARDGVDGSKILIFGEGWQFGSLYDLAPQASTHLLNSFGLGLGFFNDRLRDAARGGTTNSSEKSDQGFITGLYYDFNQEPANRNTPPNPAEQREKLFQLGDVIKAGLAGNLRDYIFRDYRGIALRGGDIYFRGSPVATAAQAIETINYVSAHDGYSLWDAVQAKSPFYTSNRKPHLASVQEKQRIQQMALALPLLSQGIPFIEGGSELLRSKSGDQDSYDSGDYFNRIFWNNQENNWGQGLPPIWKNFEDWSFWRPRLLDPDLRVDTSLITQTKKYFMALLKLRNSEPLFKLNSLQEVSSKVAFIDTDTANAPGFIAMHLHDSAQHLLVIFNADKTPRTFSHPLLKNKWVLHPLLNETVDPTLAQAQMHPKTQSLLVPPRTTLVLRAEK